jgi:hypothetical protein
VSSFIVQPGEHLIGLRVEGKSFSGYGIPDPYNGVCTKPSLRLEKPGGIIAPLSADYLYYYGEQTADPTDDDKTKGQYYKETTVTPPTGLSEGTWTVDGWADDPTSFTFRWLKKRVDVGKAKAKEFASFSEWNAEDKLGLVSFERTSAIMQALDTDKQLAINALKNLNPNGDTCLACAIVSSTTALQSESDYAKFMVILTDGQTNICTTDGPAPAKCGEVPAVTEAQAKADLARDAGITIYVIGFADQVFLNVYKGLMDDIAKDNVVHSGECSAPDTFCGRFYYASDEAALQEVYQYIQEDILRKVIYGPSVTGEMANLRMWKQ